MRFDFIEYINGFSHKGKKITDLSRISGLLERLGNPQRDLRFVHIAGTNGKGSTLEYMSRILIDAGYKTGQFTSPYIEKYNDRIRINGRNVLDGRLDEIFLRIKDAASDDGYSQFEITLAAAFIYFKEENCDIVFLETGIGGALDATNIIEAPLVSVITSVSLDHTGLLGNTVKEIACQKAGIIKKDRPVVLSADNLYDTIEVVKEKAKRCGSRLVIPIPNMCVEVSSDIYGSEFYYKTGKYRINMCGRHQIDNAVTVIEAINLIKEYGFDISDANIKNGLSSAKVKLRIEILSRDPLIIIDGGHNASGIDSLVRVLDTLDRPIIGVIGMVEGKAVEYAGKKLSGILDTAICADGYIENNVKADELKKYFSCPAEASDYKAALKRAAELARDKNAAILICGSLYLASAARREYLLFGRDRSQ